MRDPLAEPAPNPTKIRRNCPFCEIIYGSGDATVLRNWGDAIAIVPLKPVVPGHVLVISKAHIQSFSSSPHIAAVTMNRAAEYADTMPGDLNLITSRGPAATQSVDHFHLHLVPRAVDDGLALPWYSGKRSRKAGR